MRSVSVTVTNRVSGLSIVCAFALDLEDGVGWPQTPNRSTTRMSRKPLADVIGHVGRRLADVIGRCMR